MVGVTVAVLAVACVVLAASLRATHRRAERERTLREFFAARPGTPAHQARADAFRARTGAGAPAQPESAAPTLPAPGVARTATAHAGTHPPAAVREAPRPDGEEDAGGFRVTPAAELPTFGDVGGMQDLKDELDGTVGLLLRHSVAAASYGITWNGLLLHGRPGTGKTFLARAVAGEFGLSLLHVSTGDLVEGVAGASARNVQRVFGAAAASRPCLLLFDEFDSIAQRRDAGSHVEERRTVNQLLTCLEEYRGMHDLVVMAATNDLDHLDPAVVRPGRFDRHVRIDLPDAQARASVLAAQLAGRPACAEVDLDDLARRTDGMTPAGLTQVVDAAALAALREAAERGHEVRITTEHLRDALATRAGVDRPSVGDWDWDALVLPEDIELELRQLEALVADPDLAERFGVEPPSGVLLAGPPGTGKTTIGRVLAAQAGCSFYPVSAADVTSKWVGESERSIQRLFERASAHRPAIVFVDEIDAIGARRDASSDGATRQLNQLLVEMDGLQGSRGVLVVGATNRPELLDEALVRGGRLSRTITLRLPDEVARLAILRRATARMPTVGVDLAALAARTAGCSGADLKALCQQAALHALVGAQRSGATCPEGAAVTAQDFDRALADVA